MLGDNRTGVLTIKRKYPDQRTLLGSAFMAATTTRSHVVRIDSWTIHTTIAYIKTSERTDALGTKLVFTGVLEVSTVKGPFVSHRISYLLIRNSIQGAVIMLPRSNAFLRRTINVNSSRLAVVGDSVGGNMVAAVTLPAKERDGPSIKFQVLFYPVIDANFDTPSYMTYQNGYWNTRDLMKWFWSNYLTNQTNMKDPTVSPLQASIEQLKGLPPALIINAENDVLRDGMGEAYALKLLEAGVHVTAVRYPTIHDFVNLNPITNDPPPRAATSFHYAEKCIVGLIPLRLG